MRTLRAAAILLAAIAGDVQVQWRGHKTTPAEAGLAENPAATLVLPWGAERGYALALDDDQRLLLAGKGSLSGAAALGVRTFVYDDELFGAPQKPRALGIAQAGSEKDFGALLDAVAAGDASLASWAESAKAGTGFVLPDVGLGAFLEKPKGIKPSEWHARNELVHRLAQLDLHARYGRLPYWLEVGLAWRAELELCGGVYCFPARDGFVGVAEHKGWASALAAATKARAEQPLAMGELADFARGGYDRENAARAWGAAEYLARFHRERLPALCAALAAIRDKDGRITHADGSWEGVAGYEIPAQQQLEVLQRTLHPQFLSELARFWLEGASFRPAPTEK
jgi:hypothetical protein